MRFIANPDSIGNIKALIRPDRAAIISEDGLFHVQYGSPRKDGWFPWPASKVYLLVEWGLLSQEVVDANRK